MFQGTIPSEMRGIISDTIAGWPDSFYIGCSGNFTIERTLFSMGKRDIHGCDVTIYSCVHGAYFSGQELKLEIADVFYQWLENYIGDPLSNLATIKLLSAANFSLSQLTRHHRRIFEEYKKNWPSLHVRQKDKLSKLQTRLAGFAFHDVAEWIRGVPKDAGVLSFPPFYPGGYDAMFKRIDAIFDWQRPEYEELEGERKDQYIANVIDRERWILGLHYRSPALAQYERGVIQKTARGVPVYVYTSESSAKSVVMPNQAIAEPGINKMGQEDIISDNSKVELKVIPLDELNYLRSMYLNPSINPARANIAIAIAIDGLIAGVIAVTKTIMTNTNNIMDGPLAYIISDFAVSGTRYKHLSKLIVMLSLSRDFQAIVEKFNTHRVNGVCTTAFSDNPVSMKYRGVLKLYKRIDYEKTGKKIEGKRYALNYCGQITTKSAQEILAEWLSKNKS